MHAIDALEKLAAIIRLDNSNKGFDTPNLTNLGTKLMLVISELCEAQNELRDGHGVTEIYHKAVEVPLPEGEPGLAKYIRKPEGFPVEIADAIIRILDIQYAMTFPIQLIKGINADITHLDNELLMIINHLTYGNEFALNFALTKLFQIANALNIDMAAVIDEKLAFNRARPHLHGRKF